METESGGDTVEKTVLIDRTAVSGKTSPASSGKTASKPGTGAGFFRKKRKDVDLRIEELRGRRDPGDVNFSGDELPLDSLDDEYEIRADTTAGCIVWSPSNPCAERRRKTENSAVSSSRKRA